MSGAHETVAAPAPATHTLSELVRPVRRIALGVALVATALLVLGALQDRTQFHRSYLLAYLWVLAFPLGSLALLMLHQLSGGAWGRSLRPCLECAARTLPLLAIGFVPIALGLHEVYEWTHADVVAHDALLQHKSKYLNVPFFLGRAAFYFALWCGLAFAFARGLARLRREPDVERARRLRTLAGPGLGLYALTATFASFDWAMSLEPHWFSTIYGVMFIVGHGLTSFALSIVVMHWLSRARGLERAFDVERRHDVGKLTFAFVMLWAYVNYAQYLIIWSGNIAEETPWYLKRTMSGWQPVALFLIVFHFALPFALLLSRQAKRNPRVLFATALGLLALRWLDLAWLVVPAFHPESIGLHWMDGAAAAALIGAWTFAFLGRLEAHALSIQAAADADASPSFLATSTP